MHIASASKVTSEEHLIPAADPTRAPRVIQPREQGVEYDATHAPTPDEDRFVILTNADGAVNFKLVTAPVDDPGREHWEELVPHRPDVKLEGVSAFAGHLVRYERREGVRRIVVTPYGDGAEHELAMPEEVYDTGPATNAEFTTTTLRFTYTSLVTPGTVFDEDLDTGERTLLKTTEVLGGHDPGDYVTGRLWATAPDGARVPISYVHRADVARDGSAPCLLYGYGSYEHCIDPGFSTLRLSLLDRGFVFAIAHVRGGGEMGRPWYDDGKLLHKRNTFTDFIACAEHLVAERFTAPDRLVARGASAGGLLMGAITNLRPDLFAAVVAEVPFVDCLTTILDETPPAHRHRVGGVGQPRRGRGRVRLHGRLQPLRQRHRAGVPHDPRHQRPQRPPRVVLGAGQVGAQAPRRAPPAAARSTSRPRWARATRARAGATTRGRTRRSCSPSSSTPSAAPEPVSPLGALGPPARAAAGTPAPSASTDAASTPILALSTRTGSSKASAAMNSETVNPIPPSVGRPDQVPPRDAAREIGPAEPHREPRAPR